MEYQIHSKSIPLPKTLVKSQISFCEYFSDIGNQFASKIPKPDKPFHHYLNHNTNYQRSIFMSPTDPEEISRIIASLKCKNSSGHDGISSKLLKSLQPALCLPISILINKSMETGQVPADMKIAKIIPIYKSKEKTTWEIIDQYPYYHQSRKFWKKQFIKGYMAFVKLSIFFMITNTDFGRNIPL